MQISLLSPTHCSSGVNEKPARFARGFTLVELLISIAIIGLVTAIVLIKHRSFDSTVLLKAEAYDIALAIREAQVKAVSATRNSTTTTDNVFGHNNSDFPWGTSFSVNTQGASNVPDLDTYFYFRFSNAAPTAIPLFSGVNARPIASTTLERGMLVSNLCFKLVGQAQNCSTLTRLDILFRRPEYKTRFYLFGGGYTNTTTTQPPSGTIESAKIVLSSADSAADKFYIEISALGQISVGICDATSCS